MDAKTCKAAVWSGRQKIDVRDVQLPKCLDDGLIIKLEAASKCGTELHLYRQEPPEPMI